MSDRRYLQNFGHQYRVGNRRGAREYQRPLTTPHTNFKYIRSLEYKISQLQNQVFSLTQLLKGQKISERKDSTSTPIPCSPVNNDNNSKPSIPLIKTYIKVRNSKNPDLFDGSKCSLVQVNSNVLSENNEVKIIVHAVAADLKCSAGIAAEIRSKFGIPEANKKQLKPGSVIPHKSNNKIVLNLVTKYQSCHKFAQNRNQFLKNFEDGIKGLSKYCIQNNISVISMPKIGTGLDELDWNYVKYILCREFHDFPITIYVFSPPIKPPKSSSCSPIVTNNSFQTDQHLLKNLSSPVPINDKGTENTLISSPYPTTPLPQVNKRLDFTPVAASTPLPPVLTPYGPVVLQNVAPLVTGAVIPGSSHNATHTTHPDNVTNSQFSTPCASHESKMDQSVIITIPDYPLNLHPLSTVQRSPLVLSA